MFEFFWTTDKSRLIVHNLSNESFKPIEEEDREIIDRICEKIREDYPGTWEDLLGAYAHGEPIPLTYPIRFKIVNRWLKCNFSLHDNVPDIDDDWNFNLEKVPCPMRGECRLGYCTPKLNTALTDREIEVVKLHVEGYSQLEIGDRLYISERTVHNHITKIYKKLDFTGKNHPDKLLVNYAYKKKLVS